jgi:hypothetical protein
MTADAEWMDGFDHYGIPGQSVSIGAELAGEYNQKFAANSNFLNTQLQASLIGGGNSMLFSWGNGGLGGGVWLRKDLLSTYSRVIGGFYLKPMSTHNASTGFGLMVGNVAISIGGDGKITARSGSFVGTAFGSASLETMTLGSVYSLEYDITFHASAGIVNIYLNGVATSIQLTGLNTGSAMSSFQWRADFNGSTSSSAGSCYIDHAFMRLYISAGGGDTPWLTQPIVDTETVITDSATQFAVGTTFIGDWYAQGSANSPGANQVVLRKIPAECNSVLSSVTVNCGTTSSTAKFKAVLYADSSGAPGALLATGTEVIGCLNNGTLTLPFASGQSLTGGTNCWLGYISDTNISIGVVDNASSPGVKMAVSYAGTIPNPATSLTTTQPKWVIRGDISSVTAGNFSALNQSVLAYDLSYTTSSNALDRDSFTFAPMTSTPAHIYSMAIKCMMTKTDAGARTISLGSISGTSETEGSTPGQSPVANWSWYTTYVSNDPQTGAPWSPSNLNSSKCFYEIKT